MAKQPKVKVKVKSLHYISGLPPHLTSSYYLFVSIPNQLLPLHVST